MRLAYGIAAGALFLGGCSKSVRSHLNEPFPQHLSDWKLFTGAPAELHPNEGVIPYELNTTLFTDYATKRRTLWMPAGQAAAYRTNEVFEFPKGTILSKTFSYPDAALGGRERLIETRLLVNAKQGWVALPYVWNAEQTEATYDVNADAVDVNWNRPGGGAYGIHYLIPNSNQCRECHDRNKVTGVIGLQARRLNRDVEYRDGRFNQLAYWTKIGYLTGAPSSGPRQAVWDDPSTGSLDERARAYLDVNCAHCHNGEGAANNSGLSLSDLETDLARVGVCKTPVATGQASADLLFSIVPGRPDVSILAHRMASDEPKVMMPEIGRTMVHKEALELIRQWVESLKGGCEVKRPSM